MGFFKKISSGANGFFKKVDNGADKFFKKVGKGINEVGNFGENAVDKAAAVGKKVGNMLEKNSSFIAAPVAALATASGFGAPVGAAIMAGGTAAQQAGTRLKTASQQAQRLKDRVSSVRDRGLDFNNSLNNTVVSALNQGSRTSQNMINQAQNSANKLGLNVV